MSDYDDDTEMHAECECKSRIKFILRTFGTRARANTQQIKHVMRSHHQSREERQNNMRTMDPTANYNI